MIIKQNNYLKTDEVVFVNGHGGSLEFCSAETGAGSRSAQNNSQFVILHFQYRNNEKLVANAVLKMFVFCVMTQKRNAAE